MGDVTTLDLVRGLWKYHRWANRRLFEVAARLGEEAANRDVGPHFSFPTLRGMLAHIYGADAIWLARWQGDSPTALPGADLPTLAALRERWDALEQKQRAFLEGLTPAELGRPIEYRDTRGRPFRMTLSTLLHHVPNHATHHRSETATMITMISGSPPDTGIVTYELLQTGQLTAS